MHIRDFRRNRLVFEIKTVLHCYLHCPLKLHHPLLPLLFGINTIQYNTPLSSTSYVHTSQTSGTYRKLTSKNNNVQITSLAKVSARIHFNGISLTSDSLQYCNCNCNCTIVNTISYIAPLVASHF